MDGVPDLTQTHVLPDTGFDYEFAVPDPGTYWFHPHSGLQLDRGLYAPFIVEDPSEPAAYDDEVVLVIDDWTDDIGPSPEQILAGLRDRPANMDHGMTMNSDATDPDRPLGADGGDVDYPLHLINGKGPDNPAVIRARPGQRLRLRIINAAADTAYRVAIAGHRLTVTHTDGFPVEPAETDTLLITMGERYDAIITVADGAFEILAQPESKSGLARALLRTSSGPAQPAAERMTRRPLTAADLSSLESVRLAAREPDTNVDLELGLAMDRYAWPINGRSYPDHEPINVRAGQRVRLRIDNQSPMFHPMHLHGHTFEVEHPDGRKLRKDTIAIAPMQSTTIAVECNNPGQWALHCHNSYHAETGMMTVLSYRS
jgi:FtsP/CotA-like multicopper oxidase with cupredoxin domain